MLETRPAMWCPVQYLRWYVDGVLLYEVNKQALAAQSNATGVCAESVLWGRAGSWLARAGCPVCSAAALRLGVGWAQGCHGTPHPPHAGAYVGQRLIPLEPMYIM